MAATVKRHRFPARLDVASEQSSFMERVIIDGLSTPTAGDEQSVLFEAINATGMPAFGSGLTGAEQYLLRRIVLDSVGDGVASAILYWVVEPFGGTPTASTLSVSTVLTGRSTDMCVGNRVEFRIGHVGDITADNAVFNILMPHRVIQVSSLCAGAAPDPDDIGDSVGYVNNAVWKSLPKGYWLISEDSMSISKYTGYYQRKQSAMSRVLEDWSEMGRLYNTLEGHYVTVDPEYKAAALAPGYSHGVIYDQVLTGIGRWGPYPMTNFENFFGF